MKVDLIHFAHLWIVLTLVKENETDRPLADIKIPGRVFLEVEKEKVDRVVGLGLGDPLREISEWELILARKNSEPPGRARDL